MLAEDIGSPDEKGQVIFLYLSDQPCPATRFVIVWKDRWIRKCTRLDRESLFEPSTCGMELRLNRLQRRNRKVTENIANVAVHFSYGCGMTYSAEIIGDRLARN
jgi:hypothetical protein